MALRKAGIILVAENFQTYMSQLAAVQKMHAQTFNASSFKGYEDAAKKIGQAFKDIPKNLPKTTFKEPTQEAMKLEEALKTLGQTGKFSLQKISEETLKLNQALATVKKSGQFQIGNIAPIKSDILGNLTQNLDNALSKSKSLFGGMNNAIKPLIGNVGDLASEMGGMLAKFTLVAGIIKMAHDLLAFGQAAIAVAQRNETLRVSLVEIGGAAGYSSHQIDLATQLLTKQGITTQAAQQSLLLMARANISWAEASKLATIAQGSAVVAGMNSSQAFERLVRGIQKMEPELLDELGITLRRTDAYEKFAATVGKNAKELSETEKKQAILNAIYEQSESVLGVYDAAMETSGKQQASLARLIEETQFNLGRFLLPLAATSIEMQTNFWKGAQAATKSLIGLSSALDIAVTAAGSANTAIANAALALITFGQVKFDEKKSFWYQLGAGIYDFSRFGLMNLGLFKAGATVILEDLVANFSKAGMAIKALATLDPEKAWDIMKSQPFKTDEMDRFRSHFNSYWQDIIKKNPDLAKSWDQLNTAIEGTPEDLRLEAPLDAGEVDDGTEALEKQIEALEALSGAYKSIQNIQKSYQKEIANAEKDYQKGLADAEKKYQKEKAAMIKEQAAKLIEFDTENARERVKMIDDFAFEQKQNEQKFALDQTQNRQSFDLKQKQDKRKFNDDMLREARRFQLSMMQAQRSQQISDRRMRADGDVLALMEAREDFANQQQVSHENFALQQEESKKGYQEQNKIAIDSFRLQEEQAKQSFAQQTEMQREEFQRRLADFDANNVIEREKMLAANAQALIDLDVKYEEEKAKLLEQYQEKLALAEERRQEQMTALGDSLKEEGKITEEGMKEIQAKVEEVFGEGAGGDALIKGWSERSKDEISATVDAINAKINEMKENMKNAGAGLDAPSSSRNFGDAGTPSSRPGAINRGNPPSRPGAINRIGARHGFQGTVTGPAAFEVEPGVREHVSFTPTSRFGNVRVGGRVGVDVTGMSQGVSPQVEESVANTFLEEIRVAVKRLSRRHS